METKETQEIQTVGILHFVWNILSGWILWTLLVIGYLIVVNDVTPATKQTIYNIINFNISYFLYMILSFILIIVIIGIPMLIIWSIVWLVILIIGFIKHLSGEDYQYPLSLHLLEINKEPKL